jgi:tRNA(Ile)-lysidine synthase
VARDVSWREDATNADRENPRNRVRHELLPLMEQHLNPAVRRSLARLAELSRSDEAALARDAVAAGIHVIRDAAEDVVRLDGPALAALPDAVARRVVQFEVEAMTGRIPGATEVAAVLDVARGVIPRVELVRLRAEHSDDSVVLVGRGPAPAPAAPFQFNLTIPGAVQAPDGEWEIAAEGPALRGMTHPASHGLEHVQVDAELAGRALIVRNRRSGDRLRPKGLAGHKKVQDLFVDLKVPRERRDRVPIVTDGTGRIIWVAGHALAAEFGVTDRTKAVIILKLRRRQRLGR